MAQKKRFSAFEDFPSTSQPPAGQKPVDSQPKWQPSTQKVDVVDQIERIERLAPSQMLPDRFQPRRLLPNPIRSRFFAGKIDCYSAARSWLDMAAQDGAMQAEVDRLMAMGSSFEEHGQIKPITGAWITLTDGRYIFQIETGERRFWAACLQAVRQELTEEPLLRVEVIENPTRQRQVLENRHAEPPSAVGQACEVASLILADIGLQPDPQQTDEFEYFRQARSQRMPNGLWERLQSIMQLTRPRMVQLLNILQFSTPQLEMADRNRLPERVLREVLSLPADQWDKMLRISIQNQLTSDEVVRSADKVQDAPSRPSSPTLPDPVRQATRGLRRFGHSLGELDEVGQSQALDEIANTLVVMGEAEGILVLLSELSRRVSARMSRRR